MRAAQSREPIETGNLFLLLSRLNMKRISSSWLKRTRSYLTRARELTSCIILVRFTSRLHKLKCTIQYRSTGGTTWYCTVLVPVRVPYHIRCGTVYRVQGYFCVFRSAAVPQCHSIYYIPTPFPQVLVILVLFSQSFQVGGVIYINN